MTEQEKQERLDTLRRMIQIKSVEGENRPGMPFGEGPAKALHEMLKIADGMGFATHDFDGHCGWAEYGDGQEMVMVLGHLDVVPEGEGWKHEPYGGEIENGRMYGRGTADDKGPMVSALYALKDIKDSGVALKRRIRLVFGLNEETGCKDMDYYREHGGEIPVMGITPDANYPLINGEKGILVETYEKDFTQTGTLRLISMHGGVAFNVTPGSAQALLFVPENVTLPQDDKITVERLTNETSGYGHADGRANGGESADENGRADGNGRANVRIVAHGKSAHGSTPEKGLNANGLLVKYLSQLPFEGEVKEILALLAEKIGTQCHGEALGIDLHDEESGELVNNWGVLTCDESHISVTLNYRYPVTFKKEDCQPKVRAVFGENGWKGKIVNEDPALYVPKDSKLVQLLLSVYRKETGDMSEPMCIGGGTYAKSMPNTVAFGTMFPGDEEVEHQPDEYISLDRFFENEEILRQAILAMANA